MLVTLVDNLAECSYWMLLAQNFLHAAQTVVQLICRKLCSTFAQQILRHAHGKQLYGAFF